MVPEESMEVHLEQYFQAKTVSLLYDVDVSYCTALVLVSGNGVIGQFEFIAL